MAVTTNNYLRARTFEVPLRSYRATGRPSAIAGVGVYAPEKVLTNFDLEKMMDTSDKWITERTGIHRRHIAEPYTTTFELATKAARSALDAAGISAKDLDMILVGTSSPDGPFPSIACRVQDELGAPGAVAWDLLAACSSFIFGLATADSFIASGRADNVLVIGAEVLSRMLDYSNRGTAVIFGDGAGAAVLQPAPEGAGFRSWVLGSDGRGHLQVTCGNKELGAYAANDAHPYIEMEGPDVFKFAVDIFIRQAHEVAERAGISLEDIDLWVPHQANFRIIDAAARRIGLPLDRVAINIDEYGNTSSASIPLALEQAIRQGRVKSGDHVLLAGFGSGLTWGACLMTWV
jgi:3-oxoacyl-[acyl-carrier-protein] synthase-3